MVGGYVYMLANRYRGTIYTGVTSDIAARMIQHREGTGSRFAAKYGVERLVYAEPHDLIERDNPNWEDLFDRLNW